MFFVLSLMAIAVINSSDRFSIQNINGKWRFTKNGAAQFIIGLNHQIGLWEPCSSGDKECIRDDLFHKLYKNNETAAALAQLPQYKDWLFNGAGYDAPNEHKSVLPYMDLTMPLDSANGGGGPSFWHPKALLHFPDPWDKQVQEWIESNITMTCVNNQPFRENLMGYIWTDTPAFDIRLAQEQSGKDWVTTLRCLPDGAAGRAQYYTFLKERYNNDPTAVCKAYNIPLTEDKCNSWSTLNVCDDVPLNLKVPAVLEDDYLFLPRVVGMIYDIANTTIKSCDPDGIVFGDTIRSVLTPDNVLKVISEYVDVLSYQPDDKFVNLTEMKRIHDVAGGKPMIIADIGFGFPHPPYVNTEWHEYDSQEAAAAAYDGYLSGAVESGFIAALNKCEYIDRFVDQPTPTLKPGMLDFNGTAHQPFTNLVRAANSRAVTNHMTNHM